MLQFINYYFNLDSFHCILRPHNFVSNKSATFITISKTTSYQKQHIVLRFHHFYIPHSWSDHLLNIRYIIATQYPTTPRSIAYAFTYSTCQQLSSWFHHYYHTNRCSTPPSVAPTTMYFLPTSIPTGQSTALATTYQSHCSLWHLFFSCTSSQLINRSYRINPIARPTYSITSPRYNQ